MSLWLTIALRATDPVPGAETFDLATISKPIDLSVVRHCSGGRSSGEIVVCGSRRDRFRLPLPIEREPSTPVRGEVQTGMAALTPSGRCGIFAGERRCSKSEAADYGYGNGRDPITVLTRLVTKIGDPDAD